MRVNCSHALCSRPITEWALSAEYKGRRYCSQPCVEAHIRQDRRFNEAAATFKPYQWLWEPKQRPQSAEPESA